MIPEPSPWSLLTGTAALLAFLIGLYTLVGRDRKSPYLINSVFQIFLVCLLGAALDILATILLPWRWGLAMAGAACLLGALALSAWRVFTIYLRFALFIDPGPLGRIKAAPGLRQFRTWIKRKSGPSYEHEPILLDAEVIQQISDALRKHEHLGEFDIRSANDPRSLALSLRHHGQANELLGRLAAIFLMQQHYTVQYMTASRHPVEFVEYLRKAWPRLGVDGQGKHISWELARDSLVVVDAYTPHFGFADTINAAKRADVVKDIGDRFIASKDTYAGMHSAAAKAFKVIKREAATPGRRRPTLVIYEDMFALADLESVEQYRVFVRHVLPSERLWNGMFTVFLETAQPAAEWILVSSYADIMLDLSRKAPVPEEPGDKTSEGQKG